jgi:curved DNA-binding protein CbpA
MLPLDDPYQVLQVHPEAEREVIRAAYRTLALKYHPDVSAGSHDRMAALNHAWGILRNASTRAAYDQARAEAQRTPAMPKPEAPRPETSYAMSTPMPTTPPGRPAGSVLDFGRYAGWSLGQIATADPVYLEWLARTPIGRSFNREIGALLANHTAARAAATAAVATAERRSRRFRRR